MQLFNINQIIHNYCESEKERERKRELKHKSFTNIKVNKKKIYLNEEIKDSNKSKKRKTLMTLY